MRKFIRAISTFLTVVIFVVCLGALLTVIMATRDGVPMLGNVGIMNVATESMVPTYNVGDLLLIKKTNTADLKKGDVITFYSTDPTIYGQPNTHRIDSIDDSGNQRVFYTKGDNNPAVDEYSVMESAVVGKVERKIPVIGKAFKLMQENKPLFFVLIILPLIVIVVFDIRNVFQKAKEVNEDNEESK